MSNAWNDEDIIETELVFREQADGRLVAKIAGGKAVLLERAEMGRVQDGECWRVRLRHFDTFALATLVKPCAGNPLMDESFGKMLKASLPFASAGPAGAKAAAAGCPAPAVAPAPAPPTGPTLADIASLAPTAPDVSGVPEPPEADPDGPPDPRRVIMPSDRVAFFVDGANMDWSCRRAGYFVDYGKARTFFLAGGHFYAGYYYLADFSDRDPAQLRYFDYLTYSGYIVRRRPVKVLYDEDTGERILKGNLDTEIVLDMLNTVNNYDVAYLFSGDSDFERAVDLLRSRGKRVYVVTSARQLSRELSYVADKPIFLIEKYHDRLIRDDRREPPPVKADS